jgi:hypothetical protein
MPVLPPLIILISWAGTEAWKGKLKLNLGLPGLVFILFFSWMFLWKIVYPAVPGTYIWQITGKILSILVAGVIVYGVWYAIGKLFRNRTMTRIAVVILFLVYMGNHTYQYSQWFKNRTQEIYNTSKKLGERFENATFTGQWAPILCMENNHRAVPVWARFVNEHAPFQKYNITHGVIWLRHLDNFMKWYPKDFARAKILDTLWIKQTQVVLCAFNQKEPVLQAN